MDNPNLKRTLERTFYSMTRRYGVPATVYHRESSEPDYKTGEVVTKVTSTSIRHCAVVPTQVTRNVIYTASMMQSMRPFAWQGGQGHNEEETVFMVYKNDLRGWNKIGPEDWLHYKGVRYQVVDAMQMDGGWIISGKRARGTESGLLVDVEQSMDLTDDASS